MVNNQKDIDAAKNVIGGDWDKYNLEVKNNQLIVYNKNNPDDHYQIANLIDKGSYWYVDYVTSGLNTILSRYKN